MSIRFRILTACLTLTILTGGLGLFTLNGEQQLGRLALRMYDQAFMGVDFFRSAFRLQAEEVARNSEWMSKLAIGASLVAALLITASLTRSIVPPLRRATIIAREIARGNLNNSINRAGSQELKLLLGALETMQSALA